ncbi:hypothetical protein NA57DRAFT_75736 [Rhizodiscina lignyota]|uniref:Uncharacterized protein n=1 Tax=Rhizodiscina lignyota TaxID=1504668 RepID=A0A9P4IG24_9PEZI|nr:hypothetical protein NA57DRAFT_75736 [Rhizodiscina lignyota]
MRYTDDYLTARAANPRTGAISPTSSRAMSIGTGAIRSVSASSIFSTRSDSASPSSSPISSADETYGFGGSPYGASSRLMQDVTKIALSTAPSTAPTGRKQRSVTGNGQQIPFQFPSTPERYPHNKRMQEMESAKRWRVDNNRWMVGAKQGSSPKVLRHGLASTELGEAPKFESRVAPTSNLPRRVNWNDHQAHVEPQDASWSVYESPQLPRGRVLGRKSKENIPLANVRGVREHNEIDTPRKTIPVQNATPAQVEAFNHYRRKSQRLSAHEYASGFAPPIINLRTNEAGFADRQVYHTYEDIVDAYASRNRTACGAEAEDGRTRSEYPTNESIEGAASTPPKAQEPRIVEVDYSPSISPCSRSPHQLRSNSNSPSKRPALLIYRKPVGASSSITLPLVTTTSISSGAVSKPNAISHSRSPSSQDIVVVRKDWIVGGTKLIVACYVAVCLWSVLDALRAAMVGVLWPVWMLCSFGQWLLGSL